MASCPWKLATLVTKYGPIKLRVVQKKPWAINITEGALFIVQQSKANLKIAFHLILPRVCQQLY